VKEDGSMIKVDDEEKDGLQEVDGTMIYT